MAAAKNHNYNPMGVKRNPITIKTGLRPRVLEALRLYVAGRSEKEVATAMGIALMTAKNHLASARMVLRTSKKEDLVRVARKRNLIQ